MTTRRKKLPRDFNQRAKAVLDLATGEARVEDDGKDPRAVERGHKGGIIGGKARAEKRDPGHGGWVSDHVWTAEEIAALLD